ncbi:MAG TPA: PHB depolymerase family esterase [Pseudonocardiaceae bacterium]|jgi:polyhydroxybutyrate depolymerase|nr:PHB depolymerase family esterase [Pseudonocardiaceae bacterium]
MLTVVLTGCGFTSAASVNTESGAVEATSGTVTSTRTLDIDGMQRSYLVVAPSGATGPLPLVVVLHGRAVTVQQEQIRTDFGPLAGSGQAILVYPAGYQQSWNAGGGCCGGAQSANVNDTAFLTSVVTAVEGSLNVDASRVYLVGYSNGARMAFTEICAHPTLFAAFAEFGGVPMRTCGDTSQTVPALISAGTADPELPQPPKTTTQVVDAVVSLWRSRDRCANTSTSSTANPAKIQLWSRCAAGSAVESVLYNGFNHYWPRATQSGIPFNTAVGKAAAAETLMWSFLSAHHR